MRSSLFAYKTLISGIKRDGIAYGFDTLVSDGETEDGRKVQV